MTVQLRSSVAVAAILLLSSCGGGSDDGAGPDPDTTPASVVLTPAVDTILLGGSAQLGVAVKNAAGESVSATISWGSSDPALATVNSTGLVQALQPGIVWIHATVNTLRDSTRVYLAPIVTVTRRLPSLFAGDTTLLYGTFARLGGAIVTPSDSTFWTSTDPSVATVSQAGVVTGTAPGTAVIRLSSSGYRDSQVVVVLPRAPRVNRQIAYLREVIRPGDGARINALFVASPDGSGEVRIGMVDSYVLEYHWSNSGNRIVVWHGQFNGIGETGFSLYDPDGTNRLPLPVEARSARFSPDDTRIVYHQGEGSGVVITVANSNGTNARALTVVGGANEVNPEWSPDGRQIAYRETPCNRLWVMDADGSYPRELVATGACDLRWSPDGKEIAYAKGNGIWAVNVETGVSRPLSPNCNSSSCVFPIHGTVDWRYDGLKVAMGVQEGTPQLSITNRDGTAVIPVDLGAARAGMDIDTRPSWSPSGELIAATGGTVDSLDPNATRIKIVNADGSGLVPGPLGFRV